MSARWLLTAAACTFLGLLSLPAAPEQTRPLRLNLRARIKSDGDRHSVVEKKTDWIPKKTALIICDMWDDHWCKSAARRVAEMAGPLNETVKAARAKGVFIIHAPSSVTSFYKDTPERKRAQDAPFVRTPAPLASAERWGTAWCWPDPKREAALPIDDSDMGCDCAEKCKIREAWTRQIATIEIAPGDAVTDNGQETWNLLQSRGIDNVILCGVHLNMCVLGRPFGIRQMVGLGKNVALMRDLTDTMYNPERAPKVSHFAGTSLVIEHVEKYWCPSFTSTDITGKPAFRFTSAVNEPRFLLAWGKKGDKAGEFYSPIGLAINKKDEVYVTDLNNARLQKFTNDGKYLGGFDLPWDVPKRKSSQAGGIAVDEHGLVYLSFMSQHKVVVYTDDGKLVREWGKRGNADGEFNQPGGIVMAHDETMYVADQGNHRIQKFTSEGKVLGKWGEHGTNLGQFGGNDAPGSRFGGPHFLALDSKGRLYTTEGTAGRVQQFTPAGKPLLAWGDKGTQPGGFGGLQTGYAKNTFGPIAILVDRHDRVWVSSLNDRVQLFTPEGKFLLGIGGTGKEPGQFARPHGMGLDSKGHFYVADAGNQRIQKFEIPDP